MHSLGPSAHRQNIHCHWKAGREKKNWLINLLYVRQARLQLSSQVLRPHQLERLKCPVIPSQLHGHYLHGMQEFKECMDVIEEQLRESNGMQLPQCVSARAGRWMYRKVLSTWHWAGLLNGTQVNGEPAFQRDDKQVRLSFRTHLDYLISMRYRSQYTYCPCSRNPSLRYRSCRFSSESVPSDECIRCGIGCSLRTCQSHRALSAGAGSLAGTSR